MHAIDGWDAGLSGNAQLHVVRQRIQVPCECVGIDDPVRSPCSPAHRPRTFDINGPCRSESDAVDMLRRKYLERGAEERARVSATTERDRDVRCTGGGFFDN